MSNTTANAATTVATSIDTCIHHTIFDDETGTDICDKCGIVLLPSYLRESDETEEEKEEDQQKRKREQQKSHQLQNRDMIVSKPTQVDFSCGGFLSTTMDKRNRDFIGKSVNSAMFNKLRILHSYVLSSNQMGTFKNAIWTVASVSDRLQLPPFVKERAAEVFKKIYNSRSNIHNSKAVVCGCIYFACKEARINRNLRDIALAAQEYKEYTSDIFGAYQAIVDFLRLDVPKNFKIVEEISYLGSRVGVPEKTIRKACEMYSLVRKQTGRDRIYFAGKVPRITGAALICMAHKMMGDNGGNGLDMAKLCSLTEIPDATLQRRIDSYEPYVKSLMENDMLEKQWQQNIEILRPYFISAQSN